MKEIYAKLNAAAEGATFDEAAARRAFGEMSALHAEMGVAMLRARHAVQQVLTPEQRQKLAQLGRSGMMGGMHGMMGGGMMGMMKDCPTIRAAEVRVGAAHAATRFSRHHGDDLSGGGRPMIPMV